MFQLTEYCLHVSIVIKGLCILLLLKEIMYIIVLSFFSKGCDTDCP